jgi:hypothetical protein
MPDYPFRVFDAVVLKNDDPFYISENAYWINKFYSRNLLKATGNAVPEISSSGNSFSVC